MIPVEPVALETNPVGNLGGGLRRVHRHAVRKVREHRRAYHPVAVERLGNCGPHPGHCFGINFRHVVESDQNDAVGRDSGRGRKQHGLAEAGLEPMRLGPFQQRSLEAPVKVSTAGGKLAALADGNDDCAAAGERRLDET